MDCCSCWCFQNSVAPDLTGKYEPKLTSPYKIWTFTGLLMSFLIHDEVDHDEVYLALRYDIFNSCVIPWL